MATLLLFDGVCEHVTLLFYYGRTPKRHYRGPLEVMYDFCAEYWEAGKDERSRDG